jgi:Fe-S-cluster containining protein
MTKPFECGTCNKCCFGLAIHLTLDDIDRMARYLGVSPGDCLDQYVEPTEPTTELTQFVFRKGEGGRCFHMDETDRCGIHPAKPWVCKTYRCDQDPGFERGEVGIEWGAVYNDVESHGDLLQMIHARTVTTAYIARNGSQYNPADYTAAMNDLARLIEGAQDDRIKVSMDDQGKTLAMTYNCNKCTTREACCNHAALTLDDIVNAADANGLPVDRFWQQYVAEEPCPDDPTRLTFRQGVGGKCTFLEAGTHRCQLGDRQPQTCAFTPCPKLATGEARDRFFLGGGSVHDQYRLQVAASVTRQYMSKCGTHYNAQVFNQCIKMIEELASRLDYYREYLEAVRGHRYINEDDEVQEVTVRLP